ncbi:L,D-transpeptidase family protein [Phycicoccus sonneratiae]|uniref:Murein L,D-transpeptidase n=1 Tax=Phycicoccus sonneratiae TaxID=2807628 RepID=A0ABS2CLP9_9MICO|nr:L,D-transpeptidase family protein [Phycicoccus sonneraticus]MBM6400812.1 murein L,D-transpeptidase [Phycicoccus sonneraticus]
MSTPHARTTVLTALALAAATVVSGCSATDAPTGIAAPSTSSTAASPTPTADTPTPSWTPTATPTPTDTPAPSPSTTPTPSPSPTPTKPRTTMRYGDHGKDVLALQKRLSGLGYWLGEPDGSFGSLTQQAVFALQKAAGISRDGVVGPQTKKALAAGVRPRNQLSGNGIEIDLDRQLLMVVRGGRVSMVLNTSTGSGEEYTSSAGNPAIATTPRGSFAVQRQVDGQDDSKLGVLWRPKYFYRGWAVHGSPSIPPYPASHGCARVSNSAMNMIWSRGLMPIGSRVLVR